MSDSSSAGSAAEAGDAEGLREHFREFLTPQRQARFDEVLRWRTRWLTLVLTDIYQQHNASAVLRSCDAFGVQNVHVVQDSNEFEAHPEISLGSDRWLTLHDYQGERALKTCVSGLRAQGYCIAATVLHEESRPVQSLSLDRPVALMFGTEKEGLSQQAVSMADELVHLPMVGFVESFNVSVAAALCMQQLTAALHASSLPWQLSSEEQLELWLKWARQSIPGAAAIERRYTAERRAADVAN